MEDPPPTRPTEYRRRAEYVLRMLPEFSRYSPAAAEHPGATPGTEAQGKTNLRGPRVQARLDAMHPWTEMSSSSARCVSECRRSDCGAPRQQPAQSVCPNAERAGLALLEGTSRQPPAMQSLFRRSPAR